MEPFKIILNNWYHYFQILNFSGSSQQLEIQILLDGVTRTLVKTGQGDWILKQASNNVQEELIKSVGQKISSMLRV